MLDSPQSGSSRAGAGRTFQPDRSANSAVSQGRSLPSTQAPGGSRGPEALQGLLRGVPAGLDLTETAHNPAPAITGKQES